MVTPLQNAMVAAAIANDGKLMQPTLVDRVRSADLSVISQTKPTVMSHAFSADTANKLTQMMEAVVTKENTNLAINGVQVAVQDGYRADWKRQYVHRRLGDRIRTGGRSEDRGGGRGA